MRGLYPTIAALPKVELHRHLEGSLRLSSLNQLALELGESVPLDGRTIERVVQVQDDEPRSYGNFLGKFECIRHFFYTPRILRRLAAEVVEDAVAEGLRYLELQFTPVAMAYLAGFQLEDVFRWVLEATSQTAQTQNLRLGLIASVNRHEPLDLAKQVIGLAIEHSGRGVVGVSLAGNEAEFPAEPFQPLFQEAAQAGLGITIHAGEWGGAENVRFALEALGATRIGHGVRVMESPEVVALARERGTVFEVCLSSNLHSGVVDDLASHPLPAMIQAGLKVTLNTDDPSVSGITLGDEFALAVEELNLSLETLKGMTLTAAQAAFLPRRERKALEQEMVEALFATQEASQ